MIIAQWAACVMLAALGTLIACAAGRHLENDYRESAVLGFAIAILAIAAAIAVRP